MPGDAFEAARQEMVERQIRRRGVTSSVVLEAMGRVPRHLFVPEEHRHLAYADTALPIGHGQTISQPYMVAAMTQALDLTPESRALEVGTGRGYQTAVLAEIAAEVFTVERIPALSERARSILESLGYDNISFRVGDGRKGWGEAAPFDGVVVTAGAAEVPKELLDQLADRGRLVIPVGADAEQDLYRIKRFGEDFEREFITRCRFVPLVDDADG